MYRVYYLDLAAIVILSAIFTALIFRRMYQGRENRAFVKYVVLLLVLATADVCRIAPLYWLRPLS